MRMILASALVGAMWVAAPESQSPSEARPSGSLERPFIANGRISMDLSAGEYRISGTTDARVRLEWSVRDSEKLAS